MLKIDEMCVSGQHNDFKNIPKIVRVIHLLGQSIL